MAITTDPVRCSYPQLFTPRAVQAGATPKYGIVLMFDKKNKEQMDCLKLLRDEAQQVLEDKWPDEKKRPRIPVLGHDRSPIKDCDKALNNQGVPLVEQNPEYEGHYIIRANTTQPPLVVDGNKQEVLDPNKIYGGCWVKANINAYAYNQDTNQGVTFGLNGVQFHHDDDSFGGGRPSIDSMFDKVEDTGADDPDNYAADPLAD